MPLNIRPARSVTIRTRMPLDEVRERLAGLIPAAGGTGLFSGGSVGDGEFRFDYEYQAGKGSQSFAVVGRVQDWQDWRILRVRFEGRSPWLGWLPFSFMVLLLGLYWLGGAPVTGLLFTLAFVLALYAFADLLFHPDRATNRAAAHIARAVRGSIAQRDGWLVPSEEEP